MSRRPCACPATLVRLAGPVLMALLALPVTSLSARAQTPDWRLLSGLFHSPATDRALLAEMRKPPRAPAARPIDADLSLDAIVYIDPQNWTVWVNGRALRSGDDHGSLRILSVTPRELRLSADHGDPSARLPVIALRPMQRYIAATGQVIDRADLQPQPPRLP